MFSIIDDEILKEFKDKLHILHEEEDDNLRALLKSSYDVLCEKCGDFSLSMGQGKSLVFERARYDYYAKLEFFDVNYIGEISSLMLRVTKERRINNGQS